MASTIRSQLLTDLVVARANTLTGVTNYRSEVPDNPPLLAGSNRVGPYNVIYPFPANPGPGGDLAMLADDLTYTFQITCVAGFSADCEYLVDTTHQLFYHWQPSLAGIALGLFEPPPGYDPGPVRIDRTLSPPRFSVPLQYRLTATAN